MQSEWNPVIEERYLERTRQELEAMYRFATTLTVVLFPLFGIVDWFSQRESFHVLISIRALTTALFLGIWLFARRGIRFKDPYAGIVLLLAITVISVTWMCVMMDGYQSRYYAGVNIVMLLGAILLPCEPKRMLAAVGLLFTIFWTGVLVAADFHIEATEIFANNLAFMVATLFVAYMSGIINDRLRRQSFLQRIHAEEMASIREARDAARQALEIRDEFISIASHELKTPLTTMKLQNDLLRRQIHKEGDAVRLEAIDALRLVPWAVRNDTQIRRLLRLVEDMLDLSMMNSGKMTFQLELLDLATLVREVCDRFAPQFRAAEVSWHVRESEPAIGIWDRVRLEQVISNLFTNAIKYAPGKALEIDVDLCGAIAVLRVKDQGEGLSPEDRERIFRRFERATPNGGAEGLGLGLYISRKIIEGHGGRISVESEKGKGSTFVVELPAMNAEEFRPFADEVDLRIGSDETPAESLPTGSRAPA